MLRNVFDAASDLWAVYEATLAFRDKLVGGTPKDPMLIEGWLRSKAGLTDAAELRLRVERTLAEVAVVPGEDGAEGVALAQLANRRTSGFKVDDEGLYVECRQIKAMIKESTNVVFSGERWGPTRKAARSFVAERVFAHPDRIHLNVREPSGVETIVGHLSGPMGQRSTLGSYEYVDRPVITFHVQVLRDCIAPDQWRDIWCHAQESGFGTLRSQGYGRFDVVRWERVSTTA